ncbi:hypothetical protein NMY22_g17091 [Coprinellus aureogranulatus]|nr:hypothetical protein NMY22_g17091 [Coprinellus aureogranulatus]
MGIRISDLLNPMDEDASYSKHLPLDNHKTSIAVVDSYSMTPDNPHHHSIQLPDANTSLDTKQNVLAEESLLRGTPAESPITPKPVDYRIVRLPQDTDDSAAIQGTVPVKLESAPTLPAPRGYTFVHCNEDFQIKGARPPAGAAPPCFSKCM